MHNNIISDLTAVFAYRHLSSSMSTTRKRSSKGSSTSSTPRQAPGPTPFGPPFDDTDADVILQSSDQVDFYVYRIILSKSSSFFKSMFSLSQPDAASVSDSEKRPVINLRENSRIIEVLLASIYPAVSVDTEPLSLDDMIDALAAAKKYDMTAASQRLNEKFAVSKVVQDSPVVAFCAAYSNKLGEAARVAAKASLKHRMSLDDIGDGLQYTDGPALHYLWKFHRTCSTIAAQAVPDDNDLTWVKYSDTEQWRFARNIYGKTCGCSEFYKYKVGHGYAWNVVALWHNYITRARDVLLHHPCGEAVAHKSVYGPSYEKVSCVTCKATLFGLPEFMRILGEEVDKRVSKVRDFLPYSHSNRSHSIALSKLVIELPF